MILYLSQYRGRQDNTHYPDGRQINSLDDLRWAAQFDHIAAQMRDDRRSNDNFISADAVMLDLDNTHSEDPENWKTVKDIEEAFPDVKFYYIRSRNHLKEKIRTDKAGNKYHLAPREKDHVYFPLKKTYTNIAEIEQIMIRAAGLFCYFDLAAAKPAQFFFGVEVPEGGEVAGGLTLDQYLETVSNDEILDSVREYENRVKSGRYERNDGNEKALIRLYNALGINRSAEDTREPATDASKAIDKAEQEKQLKWLLYFKDSHRIETNGTYNISLDSKSHPGAVCVRVRCPWESDHTTEKSKDDTVIIVDLGGRLNYLCRHEHCFGRSWKDFRAYYENRDGVIEIPEQETTQPAKQPEQSKQDPPVVLGDVDYLDQFLETIKTETYKPISTGISAIDEALGGGLIRGKLAILGAAPGLGKTLIAQSIADSMAARGDDVVYFNVEMQRSELIARSLSRMIWEVYRKDISPVRVMQGYGWTEEEERAILAAIERYKKTVAPHLTYNPIESRKLSSIIETLDKISVQVKDQGQPVPVVFVDYLQIIDTDEKDLASEIKKIISSLQRFAKDHNAIVFTVSANNRESNKAGVSTLESGRDSSALEYSADLQLGLSYTAIEDGETFPGENANGKPINIPYKLDDIRFLLRQALDNGDPVPEVCKRVSLKVNKNRFGQAEMRARLIMDGRHNTFTVETTDKGAKPSKTIPFTSKAGSGGGVQKESKRDEARRRLKEAYMKLSEEGEVTLDRMADELDLSTQTIKNKMKEFSELGFELSKDGITIQDSTPGASPVLVSVHVDSWDACVGLDDDQITGFDTPENPGININE